MIKSIFILFKRPLLGIFFILPIFGLQHCELYQEETYVLNDTEQAACELLNDTLWVNLFGADLRPLGPVWVGQDIDAALAATERIGSSWFDDDFLIEPDVYVFIDGADTLAALRFLSLTYDENTMVVDGIKLVYKYNPLGAANLTGLDLDTLMIIGSETTPFYLSFSQGSVGAGDAWQISFHGAIVIQSSTTRVHRVEDSSLANVILAPAKDYLSDGLGFSLAIETLRADSVYLEYPDSLMHIELESANDAGYLLWDRNTMGSGDVSFNTNSYMSISIWNAIGERQTPLDNSISMELIAYCPEVKTMTRFALDAEEYLIQFLPNEAMLSQNFHLALLEGN
ncbi:MAG: hypothetical protein HQ507_07505 [Candidatus Marinimicrobia bacterium]|nr:hypothetical protein [Candidatus Neomarinimicrobiota bacterium]